MITINGKTYHGSDISVVNGAVFIDGVKQDVDGCEGKSVTINIVGNVNELTADAAINVTGDVHGNVRAGSSFRSEGNVGGNVSAGSAVTCGDVDGSVKAGSAVTCGKIGHVNSGGQPVNVIAGSSISHRG